jgi:hypothetical protein
MAQKDKKATDYQQVNTYIEFQKNNTYEFKTKNIHRFSIPLIEYEHFSAGQEVLHIPVLWTIQHGGQCKD